MNDRKYFESEKAAEKFLESEGFRDTFNQERYPWKHKNGHTADIRFYGDEFYVQYRD